MKSLKIMSSVAIFSLLAACEAPRVSAPVLQLVAAPEPEVSVRAPARKPKASVASIPVRPSGGFGETAGQATASDADDDGDADSDSDNDSDNGGVASGGIDSIGGSEAPADAVGGTEGVTL